MSPRITQEKLRLASDHLWYEIWMFRTMALILFHGFLGKKGPVHNAILESFGIHVRGLLDFLYAEKPGDDDVIAEHYFSTHKVWHNARPEISEYLRNARRRVNKEMAHLTYTRLSVQGEAKGWDVTLLASEIESVLKVFMELVPKEHLGENWKRSPGAQLPPAEDNG
jgi:hypothetical protein